MSNLLIKEAGPGTIPVLDDLSYEVVNGRRVELPPMGVYECRIATLLGEYLGSYLRLSHLGRACVEALFRLSRAGNIERRPDVAYVSYERWARNRRIPIANAWDVVPNLAVEVVSPSNAALELQTKLHDYFRAGVDVVWVIYPREQEIYVYTSPTQVTILDNTAEIPGGTVLPGFKLAVALLFEDELETEPS